MKKQNCIYVLFLGLFLINCTIQKFKLVDGNAQAVIVIQDEEKAYVHKAVDDLISDVKKITGNEIIKTNQPVKGKSNLIIGTVGNSNLISNEFNSIKDQWEVYKIKTIGNDLIIAGSNPRGTMFGIYYFIEEILGVDPLYWWKDMEPKQQEKLVFEKLDYTSNTPDFKFRGWFINDEDLLTEFINGAGNRDLDYPYYQQVVHPDLMSRVVEAAVRLRFNLIIPASFLDIMNLPERKLVEEVVKRGLFISQHHIEPVGVSAFTFFNYFKNKGKEPPRFSFYSSRPQLEEVWTQYVQEWAKFPDVIWQIGLRGIGDRPMWMADPDTPQSDEDRGALISEAMQLQVDLIKKYDTRENPIITTTLWAEGAAFNKKGYLTFPDDITVVFADNSPGFVWQDDFYETPREQNRHYGVYYHHQLWGSGPHLVQAVPPVKTYEMFKKAYSYDAHNYAIMNVSNIREFVLGLEASTKILQDVKNFDDEKFMSKWCKKNFHPVGDKVEEAYQRFFQSYQIHPETQTPYTLDGQMRSYGRRMLSELEEQINDPQTWEEKQRKQAQSQVQSWGSIHLNDMHPERNISPEIYLEGVERQLQGLNECRNLIPLIKKDLTGDTLIFFENNFEAQLLILSGITEWIQQVIQAKLALKDKKTEKCRKHLQNAWEALDGVDEGKRLASQGKWQNWYRGDKKMNVPALRDLNEEVLELVKNY